MAQSKRQVLPLVLAVYIVLFYSFWSIFELLLKHRLDSLFNNENLVQFIKSGVIKNIVWTLPALFLTKKFSVKMYIPFKDMFTAKVPVLKYLPIFLLFLVYILATSYLKNGAIAISSSFRVSNLIIVLFVGITEDSVFRGWLLNAAVTDKNKWIPILVNALLFLLIHFPSWIYKGTLIANLTSLNFLSIVVLSIIFSWTFIKSKNIWVPISLHMFWDLFVMLLI